MDPKDYDIPELDYTLEDVKKIIRDTGSLPAFTFGDINEIQYDNIEYRVFPKINSKYFLGYDYCIDGKSYQLLLDEQIPLKKSISISGYSIDKFIKKQLDFIYYNGGVDIGIDDDRSIFFGIPNPIYVMFDKPPGFYNHLLSLDSDPNEGFWIICKYEKKDESNVVYRHGAAYGINNTHIMDVTYNWGIPVSLHVYDRLENPNLKKTVISFDKYGYVSSIYHSPVRGMITSGVAYTNSGVDISQNYVCYYTFNGPSLNGPAWIYVDDTTYVLSTMKNGNYRQYMTSYSMGTYSVYMLDPIPIILANERKILPIIPYRSDGHNLKMDINYRCKNGGVVIEYYLPNGYIEGWYEKDMWVFNNKTTSTIEPYYLSTFNYIKDSMMIITDNIYIIRGIIDYIYGDKYPIYLRLIKRISRNEMSDNDVDTINGLLSYYDSFVKK